MTCRMTGRTVIGRPQQAAIPAGARLTRASGQGQA